MPVLSLDLGGTKLAIAVFTEDGQLLREENFTLEKNHGSDIGSIITQQVEKFLKIEPSIGAIGICVPGIFYQESGNVWAPNLPGWENYPLLRQIQNVTNGLPVKIDSDRACYILGEKWKGAAQGCSHAVFVAVGTGIGAGILVDGKVLRGAHDSAGAIGWMALQKEFNPYYKQFGCFESEASGEGIALQAKLALETVANYSGTLRETKTITAAHIFDAYENGDPVATQVLQNCIVLWGMAIANLVSIFNPEKIILGGGVFGPAQKFIPAIKEEAGKWAQPIAMKQVSIAHSVLGHHAGLYGAASIAVDELQRSQHL